MPNLSARCASLYRLLRKDARFIWSVEHQHGFNDIKSAMTTAPVLAHYDERRALVVAADASGYGLGAVLFHVYGDGSERPIAYASRTLTTAERNYSQLEKEALAVVGMWGVLERRFLPSNFFLSFLKMACFLALFDQRFFIFAKIFFLKFFFEIL